MALRRSLLILIGTLMTVGVVIAMVLLWAGDDVRPGPAIGTSARSATALDVPVPPTTMGNWTKPEQMGAAHEMLQQHQRMMERMRFDASPQMIQLMDDDPMWKMLHSGDLVQMEQHQQDSDRMLAQPGG